MLCNLLICLVFLLNLFKSDPICMLLHDFTSGFTLWHLARPTLDGVAFQYIWIAFDAFAQRSVAC